MILFFYIIIKPSFQTSGTTPEIYRSSKSHLHLCLLEILPPNNTHDIFIAKLGSKNTKFAHEDFAMTHHDYYSELEFLRNKGANDFSNFCRFPVLSLKLEN